MDCDLKSFDAVNHDRLMSSLQAKVRAPQVLRLMRRYLQAGVVWQPGLAYRASPGEPIGQQV